MILPAALRTVLLLGLLMFEAPSGSSPALTCNATRLPDGSVRYRLSQPPGSAQCESVWEDQNKTVIARDSEFDPELVTSLSAASITLAVCRDHLLYSWNCGGDVEEAPCSVNCSDRPHTHTVNSTLNCVFQGWCPSWTMVAGVAVLCVLVLVVAIAASSLIRFLNVPDLTRRHGAGPTSYRPAAQEPKTHLQTDVKMPDMATKYV